jgi:hypothetical protein
VAKIVRVVDSGDKRLISHQRMLSPEQKHSCDGCDDGWILDESDTATECPIAKDSEDVNDDETEDVDE